MSAALGVIWITFLAVAISFNQVIKGSGIFVVPFARII